MRLKASLAILIILTASFSYSASHALAGPFGEIVVFGDSLSDNGNLLLIDDQPKPDPAIYWEGRLSNGPVWVEYLTDAAHFDTNLTDRALGGAQTEGLTPPGLLEQVRGHILATSPPLSAVNLYVIWIGGNDYLNGGGDFQGAVANIAEAMAMLISSGAKSLLILNLPNLGEIPDLLTSPDAPEATAFSANFNRELANTIDTFSVDHPDVQIYEFDVNALFQEVRNAPGAFGFTNVTEASPNFSVPNNFDGAGHVFWDDKHPTTGMHAIVADRVYEDMNRQIPADTPDTPAKSDESSSCFIGTLSWI